MRILSTERKEAVYTGPVVAIQGDGKAWWCETNQSWLFLKKHQHATDENVYRVQAENLEFL